MNKKTKSLLYLISIIGCSNIVDEDSLVEKDSLKYSNNSRIPFTGSVAGKYVSGEDRLRGNYKGGKREGKWVFLHKNGKDSEKGEYINGNRNSEWNKCMIMEYNRQMVNMKMDRKKVFGSSGIITGPKRKK